MAASVTPDAAREAIESYPAWFHTIDLAPGVATPGTADLRPLAARALPVDLSGRRCLDVGTFDGFWAFEMERRDADEVVAIDLEEGTQADWPPNTRDHNLQMSQESGAVWGRGFEIAAKLLGSEVRRVLCGVYDLSADRVGGPVHFALCGTLLQHVRDPVGALERIRDTLVPGGEVLLVETYSAPLSRRFPRRPVAEFRPAVPGSLFTWWIPNLAALHGWAATAGFKETGPAITGFRPGGAVSRGDQLAAIPLRRPR